MAPPPWRTRSDRGRKTSSSAQLPSQRTDYCRERSRRVTRRNSKRFQTGRLAKLPPPLHLKRLLPPLTPHPLAPPHNICTSPVLCLLGSSSPAQAPGARSSAAVSACECSCTCWRTSAGSRRESLRGGGLGSIAPVPGDDACAVRTERRVGEGGTTSKNEGVERAGPREGSWPESLGTSDHTERIDRASIDEGVGVQSEKWDSSPRGGHWGDPSPGACCPSSETGSSVDEPTWPIQRAPDELCAGPQLKAGGRERSLGSGESLGCSSMLVSPWTDPAAPPPKRTRR